MVPTCVIFIGIYICTFYESFLLIFSDNLESSVISILDRLLISKLNETFVSNNRRQKALDAMVAVVASRCDLVAYMEMTLWLHNKFIGLVG